MKQLFSIGNYSSHGIFFANFDDGNFKAVTNCSHFSNCSYVTRSNDFVYLVSEIENGIVASYKINASSISYLNHMPTHGHSPCHLMIDNTRNILYVSNYQDGSFSAFQINSNGMIGNRIYFENFKANVSHIHCICLSQDKKHLFIVDLGTDTIYAYDINTNPTFNLQLCDAFSFPRHTQPRHLVLDDKNRIYVITEASCEIYMLSFKNNTFSFLFKKSLLPTSMEKQLEDTGCAIKISKNYNFLYASLRGKNLICVFEIQENKLNLIQSISCYGSTPRDISFDKSENYLISVNQTSDNLTVFSRSLENGKLAFKSSYSIEKPSCLLPL